MKLHRSFTGLRFRPIQRYANQFRRTLITTSQAPSNGSSVRLLEVGARDGLQNMKSTVPTPIKLELIQRLIATGLKNIETTSFVSPKWIPQLADNKTVFAKTRSMTAGLDINIPVLVPNMEGLELAKESQAEEVVVFASASEGFSRKNTNCSVEEGLQRAEDVARAALGMGMRVRGVVSCIFSCPYDGPTDPAAVLKVVKRFLDMGCYEVGLGDTLGVGTPTDVDTLLRVLLSEIPVEKLAGHFHDTYGQAVANVVKAYDMGIRAFDSSVAGLGGCPYAKGAKGNLATEDIVYTFDRAGVETGVDLARLVDVGDWISRTLNLPNGSRAGAALAAKSSTSEQVTTPETSSAAPSLDWKTVTDNGEYRVSRAGTAMKITLTRPRNGNAMTNTMLEGITTLFHDVAKDQSVFHIILDAEGKYFCTGMDLSSGGSSNSNDSTVKSAYYQKVIDLFAAIDSAPQTTIAVVDGPCFGGGVGLTFVCDIRLVSSKAKFTMTEIKLGLTPAVISKYLVREWGVSFLREAMLTGRKVSGAELRDIGVIHKRASSTEELEEMTNDYIKRLGQCAPRSAAACKELIRLGWSDSGKPVLDEKIEATFASMMEPGSEGEHGTAQFRKKVKGIDWSHFWAGKLGL